MQIISLGPIDATTCWLSQQEEFLPVLYVRIVNNQRKKSGNLSYICLIYERGNVTEVSVKQTEAQYYTRQQTYII